MRGAHKYCQSIEVVVVSGVDKSLRGPPKEDLRRPAIRGHSDVQTILLQKLFL